MVLTSGHAYSWVALKNGNVRIIRHQTSASDVRRIKVTQQPNERYLRLLAKLETEID